MPVYCPICNSSDVTYLEDGPTEGLGLDSDPPPFFVTYVERWSCNNCNIKFKTRMHALL